MKIKKAAALVLAVSLCGTMFGCQNSSQPASSSQAASAQSAQVSSAAAQPVEITVVTSYGGDDGNRGNYEAAVKDYEKATGNTVKDASGTSNEEWKAKIMADFETGAEPDVLFYFNGVDSNKLVQGGKVVGVDEIRQTYPEYAGNMKDELLGASPVDGKNYSVPVNGYWEGLYVNKKVLSDCGVSVPDSNYTWDQFLKDCEAVKAKGYTPIACSLQEVPHYWFEYTIFNHDTIATHAKVPGSSTDERGKAWVDGMNDMKTLYEKGYFPKNTLTAIDAETFQLMADDKAAFAIDGSWKIGWFQQNAKDIKDFAVTYVPAENERKATDLIGGISMGYYITKKAWSDPAKQKACVQFVEAMTADDVVAKFGATNVTALKKPMPTPDGADALVQSALQMVNGKTGLAPAAQDNLNQAARTALFAGIKDIVAGKQDAGKVIDQSLAIKG
ncbi:ABC transporter substrate-binding protein [Caproicibacter sp.]|uniref:ABC transporter substrate-binding protein n=1 Tax=Caproicibacter sp. TaxID=2814884 RepID=UPI0039892A97